MKAVQKPYKSSYTVGVQRVCLTQLGSADSNVHLQVLVSPDEQLLTTPYEFNSSTIQLKYEALEAQ